MKKMYNFGIAMCVLLACANSMFSGSKPNNPTWRIEYEKKEALTDQEINQWLDLLKQAEQGSTAEHSLLSIYIIEAIQHDPNAQTKILNWIYNQVYHRKDLLKSYEVGIQNLKDDERPYAQDVKDHYEKWKQKHTASSSAASVQSQLSISDLPSTPTTEITPSLPTVLPAESKPRASTQTETQQPQAAGQTTTIEPVPATSEGWLDYFKRLYQEYAKPAGEKTARATKKYVVKPTVKYGKKAGSWTAKQILDAWKRLIDEDEG